MKIVRIIARLNVGGPAKHVSWLAAGLASEDCQTLLVSGCVPRGEEDMRYFAEGLGVTPIFIPQMSREISARDVFAIWKIYRLLLSERPDIVHTHTAKAGTAGRLAGWLYRWTTAGTLWGKPRQIRIVHTYHGHIFHSYYNRTKTSLFLLIERILARMATDKIVVISKQQFEEINQTFRVGRSEQFSVIPLGLDIEEFAGAEASRDIVRETLGIRADEILVGIIGRLTAIKRHEFFLDAIARFKTDSGSPHRMRFVVIGDGELRPDLEALANRLGIQTDVIFTGSRKDLRNLYPALDIVALTSKNEGTPLSLLEAMANSRPIISTAVGGVVDLLGSVQWSDDSSAYVVCERGISVPPNDLTAFVAGLKRLVRDADLRSELGQNGRRFVQLNYSRERLLDDVRSLYAELVSSQGSASIAAGSAERRIESRV
ncbi:MAG: glycosyltransferase [Pyrinomonadaceae bacterium]